MERLFGISIATYFTVIDFIESKYENIDKKYGKSMMTEAPRFEGEFMVIE